MSALALHSTAHPTALDCTQTALALALGCARLLEALRISGRIMGRAMIGLVAAIAPYYKSVTAALIAFLSAIAAGLSNGHLSAQEWITAVIALLIAGGAVFTVPNLPREPSQPEAPNGQ